MATPDSTLKHTPLGQKSAIPPSYAPDVLCAVERVRAQQPPRFCYGDDLWQLWEVSWRTLHGLPQVAAAQLTVPFDSASVCESKSLKLYLLSLNEESFASREDVAHRIERDVSRCCGAAVHLTWMKPEDAQAPVLTRVAAIRSSVCLEDRVQATQPLPLASSPDEARLSLGVDTESSVTWRAVHSHLFRSLCPVTGQPDWASVWIRYRGHAIDDSALLVYLLSYRQHGAMHESCVESLFEDIARACSPETLSVEARFLRRGGIDINPYRSNVSARLSFERLWRQ